MRLLGLVVAFGLISLLGCSDPPRTIETAKPVNPTGAVGQLTELPKMEKPAKSDPQAVEIVRKAIDAHTAKSPERLQKLKAIKLVREGPAVTFTQVPTPQRWDLWQSWPGRMRYRVEIPNLPIVTLGNNQQEAWKHLGSVLPPVRDPMTATDAEDFRLDATGDWLLMLHPMAHPDRTLALLPDVTVNGQPAQSVRIWLPGLSDAILNFDKTSGLLVQIQFDGREQNKRTFKEFLILGHKEFLGVTLPEKLVYKSNGSQLAEFQLKSVEALTDPVDGKLFTDP
jgi:hypothetical protein